MDYIIEGINFLGWEKPTVIIVANSSCVQIAGLILVRVASEQ